MSLRIVGLLNQLRDITVPLIGGHGCVLNPDDCCPGGGSGGGPPCGAGCTDACSRCPLMSLEWTLAIPGFDPVTLCYVPAETGDDGNACRFNSADLSWSLYYDAASGLWLLVNYVTGALYFLSGLLFSCDGTNAFANFDDPTADPAAVAPSNPDCDDGPITTACCPNPISRNLTLTFAVKVGCEFSGAVLTLSYDSGADKWLVNTGSTYTCFDQIQLSCELGLWGLNFFKGLAAVPFTCGEDGCGTVSCGPPFTFTYNWITMGGCSLCGTTGLVITE